MRLGLITIGQSPREDVVSEMKPHLEGAEIRELGALDNLSMKEIEALFPKEGEPLLVSRLRDGREVKLSERAISEKLKECVKLLEKEVDVIALLCTGEFEGLTSEKMIIEPSSILKKTVEALNVKRLGVLIPDPRQEEMTLKKWSGKAKKILISSASPYSGREEDLRIAGKRLRDCDLLVLDCIGYSLKVKRALRELTGKPVLLPRTLLARVLGELL